MRERQKREKEMVSKFLTVMNRHCEGKTPPWCLISHSYVIDIDETECFMKYTGTSTRASCHV